MSFRSWIDQQISDAAERGAFDNLPGTGKPLRRSGDSDNPDAWVLDWVRREGVSTEELLPTPLKLRKQAARLAETVSQFGSEEAVRDCVAELNDRIMEWRRLPIGPPIFVPLVDSEAMVAQWRAEQPGSPPPTAGAAPRLADAELRAHGSAEGRRGRRRWWRRAQG
ncbi:MAG TPA: DUF1992 domain-containing protein [Streptosporangiaceae bacterium]|nr:DUF1992 domain-containing protein [Streptosporangiaceae bacterium]